MNTEHANQPLTLTHGGTGKQKFTVHPSAAVSNKLISLVALMRSIWQKCIVGPDVWKYFYSLKVDFSTSGVFMSARVKTLLRKQCMCPLVIIDLVWVQ